MASTAPKEPVTLTEVREEMLTTGRFSDFSIFCGTREFKVHKAILYGQSEYFSRLLDGGFKEASNNTLRLDEENAYVVQAVLIYLYTEDYSYPSEFSEHWSTLQFHMRVYTLADMLLLQKLKKCAVEQFWDARYDGFVSVEDLRGLVAFAYEARPSVKCTLMAVVAEYFMISEGNTDDQFREIARAIPEFGIDLAKTIAGGYAFFCDCGQQAKTHQCLICDESKNFDYVGGDGI